VTRPTVEQLLDFETAHPVYRGAKETLIRDQLRITPARYYQLLHRAADTEAGMNHNPITARIIRARRIR
jgi:hypothetical protein